MSTLLLAWFSFVIVNNGDSTLHTIHVLVNLNGEVLTSYTWEGTLLSGESISESIDSFTIDEDVTQKHELQVQVSLENTYEKDVFNNSLIQRFSFHVKVMFVIGCLNHVGLLWHSW